MQGEHRGQNSLSLNSVKGRQLSEVKDLIQKSKKNAGECVEGRVGLGKPNAMKGWGVKHFLN